MSKYKVVFSSDAKKDLKMLQKNHAGAQAGLQSV